MKGDHVGEFEELVLLAAAGLTSDAYGVSIKNTLDGATSRDVSIGAVYAALDRLEAKGLLASNETPGLPVRGGRRRRSFSITRDGQHALREMRAVRDRLWKPAPSRKG